MESGLEGATEETRRPSGGTAIIQAKRDHRVVAGENEKNGKVPELLGR